MATKTIYMNEGSEDGYVYSDEDDVNQNCESSECSEYEQDQTQEFPNFYENLEIIPEPEPIQIQTNLKIKNKSRSLSFDSESSDSTKRFNFKCASTSCKKSFLLDKNQKMIRCPFCGFRILLKLRTRNYITFKTE